MRNLPHGFDIYLVNIKTIKQIAQIFVAFSEKLNFKRPHNFRTISNKNDPCDLLRKKVNLGRMHGGVWTKLARLCRAIF